MARKARQRTAIEDPGRGGVQAHGEAGGVGLTGGQARPEGAPGAERPARPAEAAAQDVVQRRHRRGVGDAQRFRHHRIAHVHDAEVDAGVGHLRHRRGVHLAAQRDVLARQRKIGSAGGAGAGGGEREARVAAEAARSRGVEAHLQVARVGAAGGKVGDRARPRDGQRASKSASTGRHRDRQTRASGGLSQNTARFTASRAGDTVAHGEESGLNFLYAARARPVVMRSPIFKNRTQVRFGPGISQSRHSRLIVPMMRSQIALAFGLRDGDIRTLSPSQTANPSMGAFLPMASADGPARTDRG